MSAVITGINSMTSIGLSAAATSAAVRAPISSFRESDEYTDSEGKPILISEIPIIEDISDDMDRESRLRSLARFCLEGLLAETFAARSARSEQVYLLVGLANAGRPGPRYQGMANELEYLLSAALRERFARWAIRFFEGGNPAALEAVDHGRRFLAGHPETTCIIGGVDSLLDTDTLDYFEDDARLKSATYGHHQGIVPGEGAGFLVLESAESARRGNRRPLAEILGTAIAREPVPLRSPEPSALTGLTQACRGALHDSGSTAASIGTVIGDLNGEFLRAKEWAYAELRCLGPARGERELWHPADCFGDIGAASGAVLMNFGVSLLMKKLAGSRLLCFCSDDEAARGAVVLGGSSPQASA